MSDAPHVILVAIEPKSTVNSERLATAIDAVAKYDLHVRASIDWESGQNVISAACEADLENFLDILVQTYGIEINVGASGVVYRETLSKGVTIRYTHKKLSDIGGEFADVTIAFEPTTSTSGFMFENAVGAFPADFVEAVEAGLRTEKEFGLLAGFPVTDFSARLVDARYHEVDSSTLAFRIAARAAFRELKGNAILLEPVMKVTVMTPEDFVGGVIGDLHSRRGKIQGTDTSGAVQIVIAAIPYANMFGYDNTLSALTQKRAHYLMTFDHYERFYLPDDGGDDVFPPAMAMRA